MKRSDKLFSKFIRERDRVCQNCGSPDRLQCAHLISRSYKSIRVDEDNAVALCQSCHLRFTHNPLAWELWVEERFPGRWARLRKRALAYERVDWKAAHSELKSQVDERGGS